MAVEGPGRGCMPAREKNGLCFLFSLLPFLEYAAAIAQPVDLSLPFVELEAPWDFSGSYAVSAVRD